MTRGKLFNWSTRLTAPDTCEVIANHALVNTCETTANFAAARVLMSERIRCRSPRLSALLAACCARARHSPSTAVKRPVTEVARVVVPVVRSVMVE